MARRPARLGRGSLIEGVLPGRPLPNHHRNGSLPFQQSAPRPVCRYMHTYSRLGGLLARPYVWGGSHNGGKTGRHCACVWAVGRPAGPPVGVWECAPVYLQGWARRAADDGCQAGAPPPVSPALRAAWDGSGGGGARAEARRRPPPLLPPPPPLRPLYPACLHAMVV